jgi:transcriptional regulator with XRE-family HTH domain
LEASHLIRTARARHGLDQRSLARRAGTSQAQISRIERGEISPSVAMVERLLAAMGEHLEMSASPGPRGNQTTAELRTDFERLTPAERFAQAAELSRVLTQVGAGGRRR